MAIALVTWLHLVTHDFGAALPSGSADPGQEAWFLAWLPHALGAGANPFSSGAVFAPSGVNLLDNTSMDLLGLLFAPVTVTAGPVASLDVAVLLAPALSALAAFALCRRYVSWSPAAFAGGLCFGFGPFLTGDLRYGHLDLTWLALLPLIFCCLDALVVRGTRRPLLMGATLATLVVGQFFVSTEMLAITALTAAVVAVVVSIAWPRTALPHLAAAWRGLVPAAAVTVAALAYPLWFVVRGPHHVAGPVWHHLGAIATSLAATVQPRAELPGVQFISGSNGSYLGVPLLAVVAIGAIVLWRSRILRIALVAALVAYIASLGYELHAAKQALGVALPAAVLGHVPLLDSIAPERFAAMVDLFCGLALAVVIDRARRWDRPQKRGAVAMLHVGGREPTAGSPPAASTPAQPAASLLVVLSAAIGAFALVPFAALGRWPYTVTAVRRPAAFAQPTIGEQLTNGGARVPTLAIFPDSPAWTSDEMVWQAQDGFSFSLADGYAIVPGVDQRAVESPRADALWLVLAAGSLHRLHLPLSGTTRAAVLGDLRDLGVDEVVVVPGAEGSSAVRGAMREVLRAPGREQGGAVQWRVAADAG
ncbi:MAG: hypothetical protein ACRD6W_18520 [Nitrososphaerales archaeon]